MAGSIEPVANPSGRPAMRLRQAWRKGKRVGKETLANPSKLPPEIVEGVQTMRRAAFASHDIGDRSQVQRSLPHGHVAAVPGRDLHRMLPRPACRGRQLALAAIVARVLSPNSRLATARRLSPETATSRVESGSTSAPLSSGAGNELPAMRDGLRSRQPRIEHGRANRRPKDGTLLLGVVSFRTREGAGCPLASFATNRDGKRGKQRIVLGRLCAADGRPVEGFPGSSTDPSTVARQVKRTRRRLAIVRIALFGDRPRGRKGMRSTARIRAGLEPAGLDGTSALRPQASREQHKDGTDGAPAPRVTATRVPDAVAGVTGPDFPGERRKLGRNPRLGEERCGKRQALLPAPEAAQVRVAASVRRSRERFRRRVGARGQGCEPAEHCFAVEVTDDGVSWRRRENRTAAEARLDGVSVLRTSLEPAAMHAAAVAYRSLAGVERAARSLQTELRVRPVCGDSADPVRAMGCAQSVAGSARRGDGTVRAALRGRKGWQALGTWRPAIGDDAATVRSSGRGSPRQGGSRNLPHCR